jgi:hypothetical protein
MDSSIPDWVPIQHRPTERQKTDWWRFVLPGGGVDAQGWWLGWCPIHDTQQLADQATGAINFDRDAFRCTTEPCCHDGKRGMSLTNLKAAMSG